LHHRAASPFHRFVVYSKEGCHLCDRTIHKLREFSAERNFDLDAIEITGDPSLFHKYFLSIPVVELDGKIVFQASDIQKPQDLELKLEALMSALED
jgi:glutaredoxin